MLAGPYVKRGYTSHQHANFGSILKMIYNILDVPYVNQYDATASVLQDFFTDKPDYKGYKTLIPSREVFDADAALKKFHRNIDWRKVEGGVEMDDEADQRERDDAVELAQQRRDRERSFVGALAKDAFDEVMRQRTHVHLVADRGPEEG